MAATSEPRCVVIVNPSEAQASAAQGRLKPAPASYEPAFVHRQARNEPA
jgi:hypothetical protein